MNQLHPSTFKKRCKRIIGLLAEGVTYVEVLGVLAALRAGMKHLSGGSAILRMDRSDSRFPLFLRVPSSDIPTYKKIFIDQEYRLDTDKDLEVIVDAGANIGLASVYWAIRYPKAKIIALEPEESNFAMLKKNASPYDNIIPVRGALWNANEAIEIVDPGTGKWGFRIRKQSGKDDGCEAALTVTQGMTVERLMMDYGIEHIDLLKIDIEGSEREVFTDTAAWIDKVDALMIELHEHLKVGCNRSFYNGTNGFDREWIQGENVFLVRTGTGRGV